VCGPSGSGKSTLIKTVNGLEAVQQGDIRIDGMNVTGPRADLRKIRSRAGMEFQGFELFPHLSVLDNLNLAQTHVLKRGREAARKRGMELLERVGLAAHRDKYPSALSGGQQQRVAIARARDGSGRHAVRRSDLRARPRDGQ
jgi:glutamate/aspartate transport system ATP-binding protein